MATAVAPRPIVLELFDVVEVWFLALFVDVGATTALEVLVIIED